MKYPKLTEEQLNQAARAYMLKVSHNSLLDPWTKY